MRIGVDAGCLGVRDERLKVGVYTLAKNLFIQLGKLDTTNEYFLYSFHPIDKEILDQFGPRIQNIVVPQSKGWLQFWLPWYLYKDGIDVFLALGQALPHKIPGTADYKVIGFIYDVAFELYSHFYPDSQKELHNNTKHVAEKSDIIVTISKTSKKEIANIFNPYNPIIVAMPGVDKNNHLKDLRRKNERYILYVGALKRIKNVPTLIQAFTHIAGKHKIKLYISGGDMWPDPDIKRVLRKVGSETKKKIKFLGYVKDNKLASLYQHAVVFVSPSYYEGFGLPFAEAMSYGCPVIGSTRGSIPEVVGDAGMLVEPDDTKGLTKAIQQVVGDKKLRSSMIEKGIKQSTKFTWEKFARKIFGEIQKFEQ